MAQGPTAAASLKAPDAATRPTKARAPRKLPPYEIAQFCSNCNSSGVVWALRRDECLQIHSLSITYQDIPGTEGGLIEVTKRRQVACCGMADIFMVGTGDQD